MTPTHWAGDAGPEAAQGLRAKAHTLGRTWSRRCEKAKSLARVRKIVRQAAPRDFKFFRAKKSKTQRLSMPLPAAAPRGEGYSCRGS